MNAKLWVVKQLIRAEIKKVGSPDAIVPELYSVIRKACMEEYGLMDEAMVDSFLNAAFFSTQTTTPEFPDDWLHFIRLAKGSSAEVKEAAGLLLSSFSGGK